jgi:membrane associated rhomboid family serine protease
MANTGAFRRKWQRVFYLPWLVFDVRAATVRPMLSDRPYMRDDYQRERTSFLIWLLSATIAGFVIQNVCANPAWLNRPQFLDFVALSSEALKRGYLWTLFTFPLLHQNILHLLVLVLSVFFIGRELLPHIGERRMAWLTGMATVTAGLAWFALNFNRGGIVIGLTPILLCYLTLFACLFPDREMSFLVFFVLPVTTRPKYLAWIVLFVEVIGLAFSEVPGGKLGTGVPYSAHLGGMLAGWLYFRFMRGANWLDLRRSAEIELPRWMKRAKKTPAAAAPAFHVDVSSRDDLRAEVDRILDKINSQGFGALTPEEKRLLDNAKDVLSRR